METFEAYIGNTFGGRYTIINTIGAGESSVVFGAYDTVENRTVALKLLRPEFNGDEEVAERFATEAKLMSMLSHPNIVKIFDTCLEGDCRYFVMEYIEGITLKKHILGKGALDVDEIIFLARQILSALEAIHEKGIVHSDIKPQNVVVLPDGHVCLMDFGISKLHKPIEPRRSTENDPTFGGIFSDDPVSEESGTSAFAVGTVHYVSPEQAEGRTLDHLSDLYSFGVMLYEMTTGILPFFGESAHKIATMHVRLQPIPPTRLDPDIPEGLEKIILRAMEKLPIARFSSAKEMREALDAFSEQYHAEKLPEEPQNLTPWQKFKKLILDYFREFSLPSLVTGVLCALLVTVVMGLGILSEVLILERQDPDHVKVPSLKGREFVTAVAELDKDFYEFEVTYVTDNDQQGRVIKQSPSGGSIKKLADGEKCAIEVTVARRSLPPTMPDLRNLSYTEIIELLRAYDCEVNVIEQNHAFIEKGKILATSPAAGEASTREITLYVSAGWQKNHNDTE